MCTPNCRQLVPRTQSHVFRDEGPSVARRLLASGRPITFDDVGRILVQVIRRRLPVQSSV